MTRSREQPGGASAAYNHKHRSSRSRLLHGTAVRHLAGGAVLSTLIAALAYRRRLLTRGGVAGTVLIGTSVWSAGGFGASSVVIFFFVSSSLLSRLASEQKRRIAHETLSKSDTRDLMQTLANGGVGALALIACRLHPVHRRRLHAAFVGAFAAATADTWATEIGTNRGGVARLMPSGRAVPAGTSGAITAAGSAGGALGALLLSTWAALVTTPPGTPVLHLDLPLCLAGLEGGIGGALFDSLLGATIQQVRWCPTCQAETEQIIHHCGTPTLHLRGLPWLDNDVVNLMCTAAGAAIAAAVVRCPKTGDRPAIRP